jgi:hypothetical protein
MKKTIFTLIILLGFQHIYAQPGDILIGKLKDKLAKVKDYLAVAQLKTDVAFMKLPIFLECKKLKIKNLIQLYDLNSNQYDP